MTALRNEVVAHFAVPGKPQTAGSKRAFVNKKTGRAIVTDDNPRGKDWRAAVQTAAAEAFRERDLETGPLILDVTFTFARPKGHFGSGRNTDRLKPSAPKHHTTKPDTTKLLRAIEDALNGVIWRDDSQVVYQYAHKRYGGKPGAEVIVWKAPG